MKKFSVKEFGPSTFGEIQRVLKNNQRLKESYVAHEELRNKVAKYLAGAGFEVHEHKNYDILAKKRGEEIVVEVKSCRPSTIEAQMRIGAAQLMRYGFMRFGKRNAGSLCLAMQIQPNEEQKAFIKEYCGFDLAYLSGGTLVYEEAK